MNELLNGHIQTRRVRCGKPNCKCAGGDLHTAFYHVWHSDGRRYQKYVRKSQVESVRRKCDEYRQLQIELRAGRADFKRMLAHARAFIRRFS